MKNAHILTETTIEQNKPVKDFAFSMNRSKDWVNYNYNLIFIFNN